MAAAAGAAAAGFAGFAAAAAAAPVPSAAGFLLSQEEIPLAAGAGSSFFLNHLRTLALPVDERTMKRAKMTPVVRVEERKTGEKQKSSRWELANQSVAYPPPPSPQYRSFESS